MLVFSFGVKMNRDPGPVNSLLGYRTASSRRNEDTWYSANVYAGRMLMLLTVIFLLVMVGIEMMLSEIQVLAKFMISYIVLTVVFVFVTTESHLKKTFFRDGKRRPSF